MKIRKADINDLKEVTELIIKCSELFILPEYNQIGKRVYLMSHSLDKMKERITQFVYHVMVSEKNQIIGVVGVRDHSHLFHLHVLPGFHKRGYGRALWEAAKKHAAENSQPHMFTVNSSRYAVPFYRKLGFVLEGEANSDGVIYFPMALYSK